MNWKKLTLWLAAGCLSLPAIAQQTDTTLTYRIEASGNLSDGTYAPLWFTANRYGLSSQKPNSGYIRAGLHYGKKLNRHWRIEAGLDLAGAADQVSGFVIQQAYADIAWKFLRLSIGSKDASQNRHPRICHHPWYGQLACLKGASCLRSVYRLELAGRFRSSRDQLGQTYPVSQQVVDVPHREP